MAIMEDFFLTLDRTGYGFFLQTYSALDRYYGTRNPVTRFLLTDAPLSLFIELFDDVHYFATDSTDVLVRHEATHFYFQCIDSLGKPPHRRISVLNLYYDFMEDRFFDTAGMYEDLRSRKLVLPDSARPGWETIRDAAVLVSRYNFSGSPVLETQIDDARRLSLREQRLFLFQLLNSDSPEKGLLLLDKSGFIDAHWPELLTMRFVSQTKDYHPEGDVWTHVLEAFKYRKNNDPLLSFAILLHDLGKTIATGTKDNPYHNHSGHGAVLAERFLRRLEFPAEFIADVIFLVRHHMMPDALPRMPLYRIGRLLDSPLFPALLELYRADILSTFRGPEKYYEACRIYRSYMKTVANPFRTPQLRKRIV